MGLQRTDVVLIDDARWKLEAVQALRTEAIDYLQCDSAGLGLQGFSDGPTVAVLAFGVQGS